jgi:hypothetical protein
MKEVKSMYTFGIVIEGDDEAPDRRASAALRFLLPKRYPEHRFEFIHRSAIGLELGTALGFLVLGGGLFIAGEPFQIASPEVVASIQCAVDDIVASASIVH